MKAFFVRCTQSGHCTMLSKEQWCVYGARSIGMAKETALAEPTLGRRRETYVAAKEIGFGLSHRTQYSIVCRSALANCTARSRLYVVSCTYRGSAEAAYI
eukprot:12893823-Prorocentrum_lima.AAC.1